MKKYITPTIECFEIELGTQILAGSLPETDSVGYGGNYSGDGTDIEVREQKNNNSNMWNNGW